MKSELRPNGSRRHAKGGAAAFTKALVEAAARKRKKRAMSPNSLANLQKGPPIVYKRQCVATAKAGHRCLRAPVKGAERCPAHGGFLEVPAHPANIRALQEGRLDPAFAESRAAFYAFDRATRDTVLSAYRAGGGTKYPWTTLLTGAQAFHADTTGTAFRRWMAQIR